MNTFYHGDCLFVMNHDIKANSIDLIYLDPPFFTGKIQKGTAKWQPGAMEVSYDDSKRFWKEKGLASQAPEWLKHIALKRPDFAAYLFYMTERLEACYKVLRDTGSIYLHCDWRASHYLKMITDEIFEDDNFQNEIVWHYRGRGMQQERFQRKHDIVYYYTKTHDNCIFNTRNILVPLDPKHISRYNKVDENGKAYALIKGHGGNYSKIYRKDGIVPDDVWDIPFIHGDESVGYPTQKPLELLKRIIKASSNEGNIVLDPFCGCGTAIIAAQTLGRQWIGIDINKHAYEVSKGRYHQLELQATFGLPEPSYVERTLTDVQAITDTTEFERWVNEYFKATKPYPDKGVDGITQDGTPIQTKTNEIKETVLHQFLHQITTHPKVPQPVKRAIAVSKIGFDDNARQLQFTAQTKDGIKVDLLTPTMMLEGDGIR